MKKIIKLVCTVLISAALFTGCSTTRCEPESENDALVLGRVEINGSNFTNNGFSPMNGKKLENIEVILKSFNSQEEIVLKTDKYGLFMTNRLKTSQKYIVKSIQYSDVSGNGAMISPRLPVKDSPVIFASEGINIAASLYAELQGVENTAGGFYYDIQNHEENYQFVMDEFKKHYSQSAWLNKNE